MAENRTTKPDRLEKIDPQVFEIIERERRRQGQVVRLIPSENYASKAVMAATGSVLTNKYSEGYPHKRYYQGQEFIDQVEVLAIERAKALFKAEHANVQPYSGSPANQAAYFALLEPGDTVMGLALPQGGHLTHGWDVNFSAQYYRSIQYSLDAETCRIDYDQVRKLALETRPKMVFAGATAYPRIIDFKRFGEIAAEVGAYFVADISHISGLIISGDHPHPFPHADVVTTTTHKLLRGPRGGMILCKKAVAGRIDKAVFPGLQGGPHNHTTAAIAVALHEASTPEYKQYCHQVVDNAKVLAEALSGRGFDLVTGGTDSHLLLVDLRSKGLGGRDYSRALEAAGIVLNYNMIPFDPGKPQNPSGVRLGTPAVTSRGMGPAEMELIAGWMEAVAGAVDKPEVLAGITAEVARLCRRFPAPGMDGPAE